MGSSKGRPQTAQQPFVHLGIIGSGHNGRNDSAAVKRSFLPLEMDLKANKKPHTIKTFHLQHARARPEWSQGYN